MDKDCSRVPAVKRLKVRIRSAYGLYLMLILPLLWYAVFHYAPMYGIQIAFRDFMPSKGFTGSDWVGVKHFVRFFSSFYFGRILWNTISINLYSLLAAFPVPILFALMLNEIGHKGYRKLTQNVTYIPHFLSAVVVVSILQLMLNSNMGVINMARNVVGLEKKDFLTDASLFKHIYVWSGIWQNMGWDSIIYIASLSSVDPALYEAATIDGASRFQKICHISVPGILPTIVVLFIFDPDYSFGGALSSRLCGECFDKFSGRRSGRPCAVTAGGTVGRSLSVGL